jgi:hypothetical protein
MVSSILFLSIVPPLFRNLSNRLTDIKKIRKMMENVEGISRSPMDQYPYAVMMMSSSHDIFFRNGFYADSFVGTTGSVTIWAVELSRWMSDI